LQTVTHKIPHNHSNLALDGVIVKSQDISGRVWEQIPH